MGQVELIKETRKVLKKKIRKVVDQYGPKLFDNFDKMREVMFDPTISQRSRAKKREMKKSSSATRLSRETDLKFNRKQNPLTGSMHEFVDKKASKINAGSSMHSFEIVQDDYSYVNENLNLDYIDEIELNEAFSVFEKAI